MFGLFQLETSAQEVHENLNGIIDYQTHHRLRETQVDMYIISINIHDGVKPTIPSSSGTVHILLGIFAYFIIIFYYSAIKYSSN